jgi:hypothetical protein
MVPVLEKLIEQVVPIPEMPIKPTLGNTQATGKGSNGNFRDVSASQRIKRCLQPLAF